MVSSYACKVAVDGREYAADAAIGDEEVTFTGGSHGGISLSFADIMDLRLLNYHLHLYVRDGEITVSKLGHQTEEFFEKLWQAYAAMSERSLFVEGHQLMSCEGDYSYVEADSKAASIAKLVLYSDSLCIVPHDVGARRVPLCFVDEQIREGFSLTMRLDTADEYRIARLGRNTDPFFSRLAECRDHVGALWREAHRDLESNLRSRLGSAVGSYEVFTEYAGEVSCGLFSSDDDAFWIAGTCEGRAAVELVTNEQAATYLYRFDVPDAAFVASLRHAMEAMKRNRRIIFLPQDELEAKPIYRMAVDRSSHVRFLRACNVGRIIHSAQWKEKVADFFD